jgi:undecaprenyl diphosphate synthase
MKTCKRDNMRFLVIGDKSGLSIELQQTIAKLEEISSEMTGLTLVLAINYGSRDEMRRGFIKAAKKASLEGRDFSEITEEDISESLDTAGIPDPDLMIRTSGEERLSNFLMWQLSYSEFYFTNVAWPEFSGEDLKEAIMNFDNRHRRFGGV